MRTVWTGAQQSQLQMWSLPLCRKCSIHMETFRFSLARVEHFCCSRGFRVCVRLYSCVQTADESNSNHITSQIRVLGQTVHRTFCKASVQIGSGSVILKGDWKTISSTSVCYIKLQLHISNGSGGNLGLLSPKDFSQDRLELFRMELICLKVIWNFLPKVVLKACMWFWNCWLKYAKLLQSGWAKNQISADSLNSRYKVPFIPAAIIKFKVNNRTLKQWSELRSLHKKNTSN